MVFVVGRAGYLRLERNQVRKENWRKHRGKAPYGAAADGTDLSLITGRVRLKSTLGRGRIVRIRRSHSEYLKSVKADEQALVALDDAIVRAFETGKAWRAAPWAVRTARLRLRLANGWAAVTLVGGAVLLRRRPPSEHWGWRRWLVECVVIFARVAAVAAILLASGYALWKLRGY